MLEIFITFLRLGLTSFGGPVAHLGYFHAEFVERRKWISQSGFADLLALCQFLPGPASSQLGYAIGLLRGGIGGGFAAWCGFTLPSALLMICCAYGFSILQGDAAGKILHGLLILAAAVVANALHTLARNLAPDFPRAMLAILAALLMLLYPAGWMQVVLILGGALIGLTLPGLRNLSGAEMEPATIRLSPLIAPLSMIAFVLLLAGLPWIGKLTAFPALQLFANVYRSGALVFGGGHVVLPLLQQSMVSPGWMDSTQFLAGYGAAQAMPGPLFSFAAYLGTVQTMYPAGWLAGVLALIAIFLPGLLLVNGLLPYWDRLRASRKVQQAMRGSNAVVVGLLLAALMQPVLPESIHSIWDALLAMLALTLLLLRKPLWLVMLLCLLVSLVLPS